MPGTPIFSGGVAPEGSAVVTPAVTPGASAAPPAGGETGEVATAAGDGITAAAEEEVATVAKRRGRPATVDLSKASLMTLQDCRDKVTEYRAACEEFKILDMEKEGTGDKADTKFAKKVTGEVTKIDALIKKVQKLSAKLQKMPQDHTDVSHMARECTAFETALALIVKIMKAATSPSPDMNAALGHVAEARRVGIQFNAYFGIRVLEFQLDEDFRLSRFDKLMKSMEIDGDDEVENENMVKMMEAYTLRLMRSCVGDDIKKQKGSFLTMKAFNHAFAVADGHDGSMQHGDQMTKNQKTIGVFCDPWACAPDKLAFYLKYVKPDWGDASEAQVEAAEDEDRKQLFLNAACCISTLEIESVLIVCLGV